MEKNIDQILRNVLQIVEQKRSDGVYPPGLEQELEYEFSNFLSKSSGSSTSELTALTHLIIDRLAVIDHLAMMIVELEDRIQKLEHKDLVDDK
jgi:hypothetical protein